MSTALPGSCFPFSGRVHSPRDVARRDERTLPGLFRLAAFPCTFLFFCFFHCLSSCLHLNGCDGPASLAGLNRVYEREWIFHPGSSSEIPGRPTNRKKRRTRLRSFYSSCASSFFYFLSWDLQPWEAYTKRKQPMIEIGLPLNSISGLRRASFQETAPTGIRFCPMLRPRAAAGKAPSDPGNSANSRENFHRNGGFPPLL